MTLEFSHTCLGAQCLALLKVGDSFGADQQKLLWEGFGALSCLGPLLTRAACTRAGLAQPMVPCEQAPHSRGIGPEAFFPVQHH
jgi:hypothetical protein